ncbi:LysR family transcriptional regulator [Magnetospira sp. QH-2]|uniref:LysR family transcriptional regulator n=1 Tax=Magnetospira sp. (strain QH-2) TaxID=1288970 RepID=UPI0003E812D0|nr:LysR family transcriptional regulator [Magnetospira sp. QH-2]CCQ74519.1 Transcriptional regulator, LysR family [Magnetospira sp. QH-2]
MTMQKPNGKIPNFRHLRAFAEVAHSGSISQAAEQIHLSQPAITQALAKLEEILGIALFERRSDGMGLTEPGRQFLERVERALDFVQSGAKEAIRLGAKKGGRGFGNFDQLLTTPQLRALVAVASAGNFSLAAREAGVSQPTLHRAARDLERLSGLALFSKTSKGIDLTASAAVLAQAVKLAFSELNQGFSEIAEVLGTDMGQIVVGTTPLPRTFMLPTAINALLAERPDVHINVVDGPYDDLLHGLRHGDLDILIGALRIPVPIDDIVQEALFNSPLAVVGRAGHPLGKKKTIQVADLAAYPWAIPRAGTPTREAFETLFEEAGAPSCIVESSSLVLIRGLLQDSDRLTMISAHQIRHEREIGLLAPLAVDLSGTSRPIGITHRRGWRPTATQRLFLDCLREAGQLAKAG